MNRVKHLTKEQLFGYAADSLEPSRANDVGRHLLLCADCRNLLPAPTPQQFRAVLLGETKQSERHYPFEESFSPRTRFLAVLSLLQSGRKLAWSAGALILVIGFSLLIWQATTKQSDTAEHTQIRVIENDQNETPINENSVNSFGEGIPKSEKVKNPTLPAPSSKKLANSPSSTREHTEKLKMPEDIELAQVMKETPAAIMSLRPKGTAVLRSNSANSGLGKTFTLVNPVGETVLETAPEFRWEKVADAESYKITIFDQEFNEVLTTTVSDNRFKPHITLMPGAKYLWRVAAQTAAGEVIAPSPPQPPAMFQVASKTAETRIQSLKKKDDQFKLALFYVREGMLDLARCVLKRILTQNSEHRAAKRLLARVVKWQKENKTFTQRCGFETAPNATFKISSKPQNDSRVTCKIAKHLC